MNNIFCTDVSKDGLLQGASINLYKKVLKALPEIHLTASGGVSCGERRRRDSTTAPEQRRSP